MIAEQDLDPAGLSAVIYLKQLANKAGNEDFEEGLKKLLGQRVAHTSDFSDILQTHNFILSN